MEMDVSQTVQESKVVGFEMEEVIPTKTHVLTELLDFTKMMQPPQQHE